MVLPADWSHDGTIISWEYGAKDQICAEGFGYGQQSRNSRCPMGFRQLTRFGAFCLPNMRRLLYDSYKSGISQIYMRPWPLSFAREIQISTQGGSDPLWSTGWERDCSIAMETNL